MARRGRRTGVLSGIAAGERLLFSVFLGHSGDIPRGCEPAPTFLVRKPVEGLRGSAASLRVLEHGYRRGKLDAVYLANGTAARVGVTAPLPVYRQPDARPFAGERLILIKHGSHLIAETESQSYIDRGEAVLYRGVQDAEFFLLRRLTNADVRSRLKAFTPEPWQIPSLDSMPCIAMYRGAKRNGLTTGVSC